MNQPVSSPLLVIDQLHKSFGGLRAVHALDLEVRAGEVLGLLGPNGSGKTTVMNLISGALRRDSGSIALQGRALAGLPAWRIARLGVARTFQLVRVLGGMSCLENVQAGMAYRARPLFGAAAEREARQWLSRVGLERYAHPTQIRTPAQALTYIDQKRLELARALALQPQLLLLDEWLAGLNPSELREGIALIESLRQPPGQPSGQMPAQNPAPLTIILVEHVMPAVRALCERCVVMVAGRKLAQGATHEVLAREEVIRAYLGSAPNEHPVSNPGTHPTWPDTAGNTHA